ncbi:MAG: phosphoglucosamine mutase [Legionellales bacterium]|nr:phosphoglucosamine mutase [Legionellales bacterium]
MVKKYFGTDGIRGRAGQLPMVPEFIVKLGWAIGSVLDHHTASRVLIGKDTRITGYMFESALQSGLSAAGVDVYMLGPMPTPGIAYLTRDRGFDAGIVISASHNGYQDNGIKIFSRDGMKISDEIEAQIEQLLTEPLLVAPPEKIGRAYRVEDSIKRYIDFCEKAFPSHLSLNGLKIVLDCANGACYYIAPRVFSDLGAEVIVIANTPNGLNINDACGTTHPEQLQQRVIHEKADLGIAFDGDGDRVIMVDKQGELVDGDELLFMIARGAHNRGEVVPGIVGTSMTNLGMEQALSALNIPLQRAKVGDRYVLETLKENNWQLGGETSGHIIHLAFSTTGDGIIAALLVLTEVIQSGEPLHLLKKHMKKWPQCLINVKVSRSVEPLSVPAIQQAVTHAEEILQKRGRVLLRASGTEPLIRVMVEGSDAEEVQRLATGLANTVENALA